MLRGIFDGGGLRKQNGHWQASGQSPAPSPYIEIGSNPVFIYSSGFLTASVVSNIIRQNGIWIFDSYPGSPIDVSDYLKTYFNQGGNRIGGSSPDYASLNIEVCSITTDEQRQKIQNANNLRIRIIPYTMPGATDTTNLAKNLALPRYTDTVRSYAADPLNINIYVNGSLYQTYDLDETKHENFRVTVNNPLESIYDSMEPYQTGTQGSYWRGYPVKDELILDLGSHFTKPGPMILIR